MESLNDLLVSIDWHVVLVYLGTTGALFLTTLLRGFQNKNVAGGYKRMAFLFGTAMSICDIIVISLVVKASGYIALIGALGSGTGWVVGMIIHERITRARIERKRKEKKNKRKRQMRNIADETSREQIDERLKELGLL